MAVVLQRSTSQTGHLSIPIYAALLFFAQACAMMALSSTPAAAAFAATLIGLLGAALVPNAAISLLFFVFLAQNVFISISLSFTNDDNALSTLQATPTVLYIAVGCMCLLKAQLSRPKSISVWTLFGIFIAIYFSIGAMRHDISAAIVSLRSVSILFFSFVIGWVMLRSNQQINWLWRATRIAQPFVVLYAAIELLHPSWLYEIISYTNYTAIKFPVEHIFDTDDLLNFVRRPFLNISGSESTFILNRISGPNLHPVSFGYIVIFMLIINYAVKSKIDYFLLSIIAAAGVKGPIITILCVFLFVYLFALEISAKRVKLVMLFLAILYSALFVYSYIGGNDVHVIGLLGGLKAFLDTPWGAGLGVAGNAVVERDIARWVREGVDFGVESAIGVQIHQIGIVFIIVYFWILHRLYRSLHDSYLHHNRSGVIFLGATLCILFNGFFQEEAFGLQAIGLWGMLSGTYLFENGRASLRSKSHHRLDRLPPSSTTR